MPRSVLSGKLAAPQTGRGHPCAEPTLQTTGLIPLFYAALLFIAGILLAHVLYLRPSPVLIAILSLAGVSVYVLWKAPRLAWLPTALIWLLLGFWSAETEPLPSRTSAISPLANGLLRTVEGVVDDAGPIAASSSDISQDSYANSSGEDPVDHSSEQAQRVDLRLTAAEVVDDASDAVLPIGQDSTGLVRVTILWPSSGAGSIRCGQRLRAVLRMLPPETYHDPGVWSRAAWLEGQNISAGATLIPNSGRLEVLAQPERSLSPIGLHCLLRNARETASNGLEALPKLTHRLPKILRISPEDAAMLAALITGDRTFLTRSLRGGFERTGSFHLIVISGLHLAILSGLVFALARKLRLSRLPATALTITVALSYAAFIGFAIPAQRSFWMIVLYLIGRLAFRGRSPLNVIGFAAICLLSVSPGSLFEASLQMTLLSVAAIAGVALPFLDRTTRPYRDATRDLAVISIDAKLQPEIAQFRVTLRLLATRLDRALSYPIGKRFLPFLVRTTLRLAELIFVALIVELALALPMATYFHRLTLYALPVNLLILPMLTALVPCAMLLLLVLAAWPSSAIVPAAVCAVLLHLGVWVVHRFGSLILSDLRIPEPGSLQTVLAAVMFVVALQLTRGSRKQRRVALAAMVFTTIAALWPRSVDHPVKALLFEAIDVGQGDSLLLITPGGKTLLIDGGGLGFLPTSRSSNFDIGEQVVSPVLWRRGIYRLDVVALTHAHQDHMGGLPAILRNFHPREFWIGNNPLVPAYAALLRQASAEGVSIRTLRAGDELSLDTGASQVDLRVLAPQPGYQPGRQPANNDSLVLKAKYRQTSILLAGDAEAPEEAAMLTESSLQSNVLKVGHHGSLSSTRPGFLAQVAPSWAVISCGIRNRFGHPRPEILAELQAAHTRTLRTDIDGVTCLVLDGQSVSAQPMCR